MWLHIRFHDSLSGSTTQNMLWGKHYRIKVCIFLIVNISTLQDARNTNILVLSSAWDQWESFLMLVAPSILIECSQSHHRESILVDVVCFFNSFFYRQKSVVTFHVVRKTQIPQERLFQVQDGHETTKKNIWKKLTVIKFTSLNVRLGSQIKNFSSVRNPLLLRSLIVFF